MNGCRSLLTEGVSTKRAFYVSYHLFRAKLKFHERHGVPNTTEDSVYQNGFLAFSPKS